MPLFNRSSFTEDTLCRDHYYIPTERERKRLSKLALAELLARPALAEPARILVEHELNIRLAQVQSRAAYVGIVAGTVSGLLGVILGWVLNQYHPEASKYSQNGNAQATTENAAKNAGAKLTPPVPIVAKEVQPSGNGSATQNNGANAKQ